MCFPFSFSKCFLPFHCSLSPSFSPVLYFPMIIHLAHESLWLESLWPTTSRAHHKFKELTSSFSSSSFMFSKTHTVVSVHLFERGRTSLAQVIGLRKSFSEVILNRFYPGVSKPCIFHTEQKFPREKHGLQMPQNMSKFPVFPIKIDALVIFLGKYEYEIYSTHIFIHL